MNIKFFILTNINQKKEIIDYLYNYIDIYNIRYIMLKTECNAQVLKYNTFYITPHYNGYNYILLILKLSDKINYCFLISRFDLKFNKIDINLKAITIYKLNINYNYINDIDEYVDTIVDGKLLPNNDFLINDIFYLKNKKLLLNKIDEKLLLFQNEINKLNNILNINFNITLIKLYNSNEIKNIIYSNDKNITGIIFLSNRSSKIYIYVNEKEFEEIKNYNKNIKNNYNITENNNEQLFLLKKTNIIDVYEVYKYNQNNDNNIKEGIASVPNINLSHKLRNYFKNNEVLITKCIFDKKFSKWKPII